MEIGTIISTINSPSPNLIEFVVNVDKKIHSGQFVEVEYSEGKLIALVTDIIKTNKYFERADSVKEFESNVSLKEQFPVAEWEYLVAQAKPLGIFYKNETKRVSYPPSPGAKVNIAANDSLKRFFKFEDNGLYLGNLIFHNVEVKLNMTKLLKKHLCILAMSGAGKSNCAAAIIEELLCRKKEEGRIAIVVLDPHGEYASFATQINNNSHSDYSKKTRLVKGRNIRIGVSKLDIGAIASIVPGLSVPQKRELSKILNELKREMKQGLGPFDLKDLEKKINDDTNINKNTKTVLLSWLTQLHSLRLFARVDNPSIVDLVMPATLTVIDLSDITDMKKKQIIVSHFAHTLFKERKSLRIPPCLLVIEEAHQFSPQTASQEQAISRNIIRTIAREGRKFGICLCIISQRPVHLDTTTLAQCNSQLILRITNPYDLKHIAESTEGIDQRHLSLITTLQVGEALLFGEATGFPLFFKIRKRNSIPSKHEISLEEASIMFERSNKNKEDEARTFLDSED